MIESEDEEEEEEEKDKIEAISDEQDGKILKKCIIQVRSKDDVYRSRDAILNRKYNYFFIDAETKHFVFFIDYNSSDNLKTSGIEFDLENFFPLNSDLAIENLLDSLKEKILNKKIQVSYISNPQGNIIKSIEFC